MRPKSSTIEFVVMWLGAASAALAQFSPPPYPTTSTPDASLPEVAALPSMPRLTIAPATASPIPEIMPPPMADHAAGPTPAEALPALTLDTLDGQNALGEIIVDEPSGWYQPRYWLGPTPWDTGLELGLNGSTGTNESLSIRTGGYVKRESRFSKLDLSGYYNRTTNGGVATQNNAQTDVRNDWLLGDRSPWTLFGAGNVFYDQFQAFDLQVNANTGVGYRFVDAPDLTLIARVGGGASREFGGPDDRWVPESIVGAEYDQHLSTNQKFYGKLDYYPEWDLIGEYRLVADVGFEIELDQPSNLSLKLAATDRYDSTPNGAEPHLVNYSVLLLLKL